MKNGRDEGFFIIDGQKSPIHCLLQTTYEPGYLTPAHYHNYIEILYGIDCDAVLWVDEREYSFKAGDICFINKEETHSVYSGRAYNKYFVIKFSPELLMYDGQTASEIQYILPVFTNSKEIDSVIHKSEPDASAIEVIMKNIGEEWKEKRLGYELVLRGWILQIFCYIVREWHKKNSDIFSPAADGELVRIIQRAANYASEDFVNITEQEAARLSHMSYSYFSRNFKKVMGKSFTRFLNERRLDAAKRMLLTTDKSITQISSAAGFSSTSHFIASFRTYAGMTPLQYKRKYETKL